MARFPQSRNWQAVLVLGALVAAPLGGCTGAGDERLAPVATASIPQARLPQAPAVRRSYAQATGPEWSGESGGSGHPLMQADAIRQSAVNFQSCLQGLYPAAAKRGISRTVYDNYTRDLTPDLRIMDLVDAQP
ncbi:MAG: lytic murein transglycosylase, partial [Pseudorhodoplanes sp.]